MSRLTRIRVAVPMVDIGKVGVEVMQGQVLVGVRVGFV